ncbi:hypothetical protein Btru_002915 [Bulinus truncatus]|nr:hypothetical protein Btru_002915 [Bulinus truncatus]
MADGKQQQRAGSPRAWSMSTMWTTLDVHRYICDIGYSKYAKWFSRNAITGKDLANLTVYDLQRLGVDRMDDAVRLHAIIRSTTTTMLYNFDNPDQPPNISYLGAGNRSVTHLHNGVLKLPALLSKDELRLPYRGDLGDRCYRYHLPVQSYHDHCMSQGRADAWKMYNSLF